MGAVPTPLDERNSWLTGGQRPNKQGQKAGNREVSISKAPVKGHRWSHGQREGTGKLLRSRLWEAELSWDCCPIKQNGICHCHLLFLGPVSLSSG